MNPWQATPRPQAKETPRERVLDRCRAGDALYGCRRRGRALGRLVRLLILTGQRRGEVAGMRWDEFDLRGHLGIAQRADQERTPPYRAPDSRGGGAAAHRQAPGRRRAGFRRAAETAFSGFGKLKDCLDTAMDAAAKEAGKIVTPWTMHDLRRTIATGLQSLGVRLEVTEALLNHVSGSRSGIVGVYQRHGWETEKAAAMCAWTAHVLAAAEGRTAAGNVVALRGDAA